MATRGSRRAARSRAVREEFEHLLLSVGNSSVDQRETFWDTLGLYERHLGSTVLEGVRSRNRSIARAVRYEAKSRLSTPVGRVHGMAMFALHAEVHSLPGRDADDVRLLSRGILSTARTYRVSRRRTTPHDPARHGLVAMSARLSFRNGAATARDAAEGTLGRPLADGEWNEMRERWEAAWAVAESEAAPLPESAVA